MAPLCYPHFAEVIMRIGFIGLGAMGKPMAINLVKAGYSVAVFDVSTAAVAELATLGAETCASPMELGERSEVVITMLPNAKIVEAVLTGKEGVLSAVGSLKVIIDMSSVGPDSSRAMSKIAKEQGVSYVDAPVSGGVAGAQAGTLTIMVGGDAETVAKIQPVLEIMGQKVYHVGDVGSGDAVKLVNNLLLGVNMAAVAEALVLGAKSGLKPEVMVEIIKGSSGRSYALEAKAPNFILKDNFAAGFAIDLQYKDLELAVETAKAAGVPIPLTTMAQQVFEMARAKGLGRQDISAVIKVWEELVGIQVRNESN